MASQQYDTDYAAWVAEQIRHLKFKDLEKLDIEHLIAELEGMGKSDRRSLESNFRVLLAHLLPLLPLLPHPPISSPPHRLKWNWWEISAAPH